MTPLADVVLYTPDMWKNLFSKHRLNFSNLQDAWRRTAGGELTRRRLDVAQSGVKTAAYARIRKARRAGELPVLILPIGHCAENIDTQRLRILGPAIATRNDIFVFRRRRGLPEGAEVEKKMNFIVAVREVELTTSNISRVVLHHATPDVLFPPKGPPPDWPARRRRFNQVIHWEVPEPEKRAKAVVEGRAHAAIFMGRELEKLKPFAEELIDAANLNRLASNLYSIRPFPRALYVAFEEHVDDSAGRLALEQFAKIINDGVRQYQSRSKDRHALQVERRTQQPSLTGSESREDEIDAIIKFTTDMLEEVFERDREGEKRARPLVTSDFIFYDAATASTFYSAMLKNLSALDAAEVFDYDAKNLKLAPLDRAMKSVCGQLALLPACTRSQIAERVRQVARSTGFTDETELRKLLRIIDSLKVQIGP